MTLASHKSEGKPLVGDADPLFWLEMGEVLKQALPKYPNDADGTPNWWKGGEYRGFIASIDRHAKALAAGEDFDKESGLHHAAHAAVDSMFLWSWMSRGVGTDNRLQRGPAVVPVLHELDYRVTTQSPFLDEIALSRVVAMLDREGQESLASELKRIIHNA